MCACARARARVCVCVCVCVIMITIMSTFIRLSDLGIQKYSTVMLKSLRYCLNKQDFRRDLKMDEVEACVS